MGADLKEHAATGLAPSAVDLRELLRGMLRQKWTIAGVFAAVVIPTIFITLGLTKTYQAKATLQYDPNPPRPLGSDVEDVANPASNFLSTKEWYQTQNTIIASRTIAQRVVDKLNLHRDADFMHVPEKGRSAWSGATPEEAVDALLEALTVRQERETRVARVEVVDSNPERAALLANTLVDTYTDWVMEERLGSSVRAVEWLSGQLDDISKRLDSSEHELYSFRRRNNVLSVSLADQQNSITQTINSFNSALTEAVARRIQVSAKLSQFEDAAKSDPMEVHAGPLADSIAMAELRRRYSEVLAKKRSLATIYGPNHPQMRGIEVELETLVSAARREVNGALSQLRSELHEVEEVARGLQKAKQQTQNLGLDLNLHEINYNRLERERANNEKLHGLLLQRTTETNLTRLLRVSPVRIVDRARVPTTPVRPRTILNVIAGCFLGLLGGLGIAFVRLRMDRSVSTPEEILALGAPVLGLIPGILEDRDGPRVGNYGVRRRRRREAVDVVAARDLVVHMRPRSSVAECCRTIRTNLAFMSTDKPLRTIVVTSPGPAEGKSTVAMSLAITFAQSGRRVILVDTDLRRPRLHKALGLVVPGGVTTALAGEQTLSECVHQTEIDRLFVLPCGPIPPNPSELLHTAAFGRILAQLREDFDIVVLDSPPVGVVIDAAIIGPQVDGVLLVAKSERTTRDALSHALRQMNDVGSRILGCVLNEADLSKQDGYGAYYYYAGGYYQANQGDTGGDGPGPGAPGTTGAPQARPAE